ncbi:MAG: pyridoxamine 5'-phosphate oxidase family protein [Winogradskyella sp.]|uniref:pyridoxamine 5'-phosphate oxidase family protein n=1 Tax=Winogradskyella sp. TaxID=1883156 RepID=UPI0025E47CB0|nr:pyridoxamine 5'-phosphate oxidase family protein [Winogradskyella sp.]NRB82888.1 pyridoxamine 5'-phosphate oxidase family protein [Winogradskyella sp.]
MELEFLEKARRELINGYVKKRHPFRYFTLATIEDGKPRQRTVVLRKIVDDFVLLVYTDERSQKVADIANNPNVNALFYHPKQLLQIRIDAKAEIITDADQLKRYWQNIPENSRKDYITVDSPGTTISNSDQVHYDLENSYFTAIRIIPKTLEYLQLKRPNHLRIKFEYNADGWKGEFLVP